MALAPNNMDIRPEAKKARKRFLKIVLAVVVIALPIIILLLSPVWNREFSNGLQKVLGSELPDTNFNTLSTQYNTCNLMLDEGSWINVESYSKLTCYDHSVRDYPTITGVCVRGGATFHVYPRRAPHLFIKTKRLEITILDSVHQSNVSICDYQQSPCAEVTVFSGMVSVTNGHATRILVAGQRTSITSAAVSISVLAGVPVPDSLNQRPELFDFSNVTIKQAMDKIRQWYGKSYVQIGKGIDTVTVGCWGKKTIMRTLSLEDLKLVMEGYNFDLTVIGDTLRISKI